MGLLDGLFKKATAVPQSTSIEGAVNYEQALATVKDLIEIGLIENYAKSRLMTPSEREQFLNTIFQASGW